MEAPDRDLWVVLGQGRIPQGFDSLQIPGSLPDNVQGLEEAVAGLGKLSLEAKVDVGAVFQNDSAGPIFNNFLSQSRVLQESLDLHEAVGADDLAELGVAKEQLSDVIRNQFPELSSDHIIYHMIDLLSLDPVILVKALYQNRAGSIHAETMNEKKLAVSGFSKQTRHQPVWTKTVSGLPETGKIDIALAVPGMQTLHVLLTVPEDDLQGVREMTRSQFQWLLSHILSGIEMEDSSSASEMEAIRLSRLIKNRFTDILPLICHVLLTGQKANFDLSRDRFGIEFQTTGGITQTVSSAIDSAAEIKIGERDCHSAYLIRKISGIRGSGNKTIINFKEKIRSIRSISDVNMKKFEQMYRENKAIETADFQTIFEKWIDDADTYQKLILNSLSETGDFPKNYNEIKKRFKTNFANIIDLLFRHYDQDFFSSVSKEGESSLFQELIGMREDVVLANMQHMTDSLPMRGLDPKTFERLYPDEKNRSGPDTRMISRVEHIKDKSYMKEGIGLQLVKKYYQEIQNAPEGTRLFSSAHWESEVSEGKAPFFRHGVCHFGMAKYSTRKREWISAKEAEIPVDIRHLPIDSREKVAVFFSVLRNICDGGRDDPAEVLQMRGHLFSDEAAELLADYIMAFKDVIALTMAKVRYAVNFPDVEIPGVQSVKD
jgi:hypothetical protein